MSALEFAGNVDVTDENTIPVVRAANKLYVNIGEGEFHPDWAAITNNASVASEAHPGDFMLLDVSDQGGDPWTWIDGGTPPSSDGLWTEAGGKLSPATLSNDVLVGGADAASAKIQLNAPTAAPSLLVSCSRSRLMAQIKLIVDTETDLYDLMSL